MSIDRPSIAANSGPFRNNAMEMVASAMDGAAPNKSAKLLGRKTSERAANPETEIPAIRKRRMYSNIVRPG